MLLTLHCRSTASALSFEIAVDEHAPPFARSAPIVLSEADANEHTRTIGKDGTFYQEREVRGIAAFPGIPRAF